MGETTPSGPVKILVDCDEPGCIAEAVLWKGDPMKTEPIYPTPAGWLLRVVLDDDDGVIGFGDDPDVRTAPLGVVGGAVVGVLTGLSPR
jgi:hypothetical protein